MNRRKSGDPESENQKGNDTPPSTRGESCANGKTFAMNEQQLIERIQGIGREMNLRALGVAVHDYEDGRVFELDGDRWFHAASGKISPYGLRWPRAVVRPCFWPGFISASAPRLLSRP